MQMAQEVHDIAVGPAVRAGGSAAPKDRLTGAKHVATGEVPIPAAAACLSCLAGGWIAAGSVGMLDDALRHALMWAALALAVFTDRVFRPRRKAAGLMLIIGGVFVVAMGASRLAELNILAAALLAALLAATKEAPAKRALVTIAQALVVLALWRLLVASVPVLWVAADRLGRVLGLAGSAAADRPLWTGATFGGVDFLVTMLALLAGYLPAMRRRRVYRGLLIFFTIVAGHLLYLVVLAFCPRIVSTLPDTARRLWDWAAAVRTLAPWNVPALAGAIDLAIAAAMIRWSTWPAPEITPHGVTTNEITPYGVTTNGITPHGVTTNGITPHGVTTNGLRLVGLAAAIVVAAALPFAATFSPGPCSLAGKKVVTLDSLAEAESFGMLGDFVESLGGRWSVSADLSPADLAGASVLLVLDPNRPWQDGQLARIGDFVRGGGSLLVAGSSDANATGPCNELLHAASMRLRPGAAIPAVKGWAGSIEALSHPATTGIGAGGGVFGPAGGAPLAIELPAWPVLAGRWGWADAPDAGGAGAPANGKYDAGEKLGDLILSAERKLGKGSVVALAGGAVLDNLALVGSHAYVGRLLGYLAARPPSPAAFWRQAVCLLAGAVLAMLLLGRAGALRPGTVAIILACGLWASTQATDRRCQPLPDGRGRTPNGLAYIDRSHLGDFSTLPARPASLDELALTLVRSGMVVMSMDRFDAARLERAGVFVTVAPQRAFTGDERRKLSSFVRKGGVFICLAGWQQQDAVADMLADFGLVVGDTPPPANANAPMPQPLGRIGLSYLPDGDNAATRLSDKSGKKRRATVHFQSAWPVAGGGTRTQTLVRARRDKAVVVMTSFGAGKVVLIGDATFAANRNLEIEAKPGKPNEANRQNVEFWRWLLAQAREPSPAGTGPASTPTTGAGANGSPEARP